jgi:hypothetical protein
MATRKTARAPGGDDPSADLERNTVRADVSAHAAPKARAPTPGRRASSGR